MASEVPAKAPIPGLARTFFSVFEPGTTSLNRTGLHLMHLLDSVKNIIRDGYHAASRYIAYAATRIAKPMEVCILNL